uniref:Immunoglobulin superfamily member 3 n=1 Tax=Callorhinchus milii TaxID=7868 RepID=A0A4W3GFD4_CALMI|eukprot:gi/632956621/ref/XP_007894048.1/ PREDICTED: immunoglobulin superfamily member 3-like [Callorhinchus milii]
MNNLLVHLIVLALGVCTAQRLVQVQESPLVRAEGYHITILCNVSGYSGSTQQNFEWSIYLPSAPERQIQIISTNDPTFPYAVYGNRVQNKEIYIERVDRDSVLLHITNLQPEDAGQYECHTPNTESAYWGSYSAKGNLIVIPDTLSATSVPQTLSKVEGDSLELLCEVSKQTLQHTHLAVSWYLQKGDQNLKVISLTRDFILRPGEAYRQRQASGNVRLDKTGGTLYKLTIYKLQPFDKGEFFCEAREWIQDADKSWYTIATKRTDKTIVNIKGVDRDFSVQLENDGRFFTAGDTMELKCVIDAQNVQDRYFSVLWIFNGTQIANIGRNAVPTVNGNYASRDQMGRVRFAKESDTTYLLKIYHVRLEDSGKYHCRVTESEKTVTGDFISRETTKSGKILINVQPVKSDLSVVVTSNTTRVLEGDLLEFVCNVRSAKRNRRQLTVVWQLINKQKQTTDIISLDRDGTQLLGTLYRVRGASGEVRLARVRPESFTLVVHNAMVSDDGEYVCTVAEWVMNTDGDWQRIGKHSDHAVATVTPLESSFSVTAITRTPSVVYDHTFELQCFIRPVFPSRVPVSVTWKFQPGGSGPSYELVTFTHDATIAWGDEMANFKTKTLITKSASNIVRLSVSKASDLEAGRYQCVAELWHRNHMDQWIKKASKSSNPLEVKVKPPDCKLKVDKMRRNLVVTEKSDVHLNCSIRNQTSPDAQFAVLWYMQKSPDKSNKLILKSRRDSVVEHGNWLGRGEKSKERLQFDKPSTGLYTLVLQNANVDDSGWYYCQVEEWLLNPNDVWYKLGEKTSESTVVTVQHPENNLQILKTEQNISMPEDSWIQLDCNISNRTSLDSQLSVTWYVWRMLEPERQRIFRLNRNSVFEYGGSADNAVRLKDRLQFERSSTGLYSLGLQRATTGDSGGYYCHVEEWLLDPQNIWYKVGEDQSGMTAVTVQQPEFKMQVDKTELNITVSNKGNFQLNCNVTFRTRGDSRFAVSWLAWKSKGAVDRMVKETILKIDQNSVFEYGSSRSGAEGMKDRLKLERPSSGLYSLTVRNADTSDSGSYYCHVEEWIQNANNAWYKLGEGESGLLIITIQNAGSSLQEAICSNDALFYFIFFYPFPIFGILLIAILLTRYKTMNAQKKSDGKNGVPLLWIKEPAVTYSPTSLEPPDFRIGPGGLA